MYFWNTRQLVEDLKTSSVSERDFKNYYLASVILFSLIVYVAQTEAREDLFALVSEAVGVVVITILGIDAAYKANGGSTGSRFVEKAIAISFPLFIKIGVTITVGTVLSLFALGMTGWEPSAVQLEWTSVASAWAFELVYVWRLVCHMKAVNTPRPEGGLA